MPLKLYFMKCSKRKVSQCILAFMQELGKFNLKINVTLNGLEKCTRFTINNKSSFIDSFQFLRSSLDSLVKNLNIR